MEHSHVSNICTNHMQLLKRALAFFRRNMAACPQKVKESAYKGLMRPVLEYVVLFGTPKVYFFKVQKTAARFVTGNYMCTYETGSMTGILEQLNT